MPSTPRCHEMPHDRIQVCSLTNWNPSLLFLKANRTQSESRP